MLVSNSERKMNMYKQEHHPAGKYNETKKKQTNLKCKSRQMYVVFLEVIFLNLKFIQKRC